MVVFYNNFHHHVYRCLLVAGAMEVIIHVAATAGEAAATEAHTAVTEDLMKAVVDAEAATLPTITIPATITAVAIDIRGVVIE